MITGNMTLSSRPTADELHSGKICGSCLSECDEVGVDDSFSDGFGFVTCWGVGSDCCGAETFDGKIFFHKSAIHKASKDYPKYGIQKGEKYRATIENGYFVDNGEHKPIYNYTKRKLKVK